MNENKQGMKKELYITKGWTISFLSLIGLMIIVYLIWLKPKDTNLKQSMSDISTLIPLFTYISSVLTEIGEAIIMIAKAFYDNWREKRQERRERELEEARLKGAQEQHEKWIVWADNGKDEATRPKPPAPPKPVDNARA